MLFLRVSGVAAVAATAFLLAAGAGARGGSPSPLTPKLTRALAVSGLSRTQSAAVAVDLATGEVLFKRRRYVGLEPASNEKLPVTFAALHVLGGAFKISTLVLGEGGQAGKVWRGNLVLKGYGDPTLSSRDLKRLAWLVRGVGIRKVTGSIVGDESYFDSKRGVWGWKPYFYGGESPPLSALAVDRCAFHGRLAARPAVAAAALFRQALIAAGVSVRGKSTQGRASKTAVPLVHVNSPPLWKILRFMDQWSDNFTAELLLKQLGAREGHGTSPGGAAVVRRTLDESGIPLAGVRIVDGSGLSVRDRLTVAALVGILTSAWSDPAIRKPFQSALAIAGKTGTMRKRLLGASTKGHVFAKTGTTNEASALAGFVKDRYAFAILHNGFPLASWYAKEAEDRFVSVLAAAK
jgi:D-alanyl-D-alanine carboxypeptidase/D-alanyl-D-alanine-endopeptidase (penicillin-binding protein 4)